jgi:anti-sigma regulatory factor (Ser/Thr protein kinase)
MIETLRLRIEDSSSVGHARRKTIEFCKSLLLPFSEEDLGNIALVITELGTNIIKYAEKGDLVIHPLRLQEAVGLQILSIDHGPGFSTEYDVYEEGKSSAGTLGFGLSGIRRISKVFDYISINGLGVILVCQYWPASMQHIIDTWGLDCGGINVPKPGEPVSGDCWSIEKIGDKYRVLLVDGLGHGLGAAEAANQAVVLFKKYKIKDLHEIVQLLHQGLQRSRGVVLSVTEIDSTKGKLTQIGVGNISTKIITQTKIQNLLSVNGTIGFHYNKLYINEIQIEEKSLVILHSDGISNHWDNFSFEKLWNHHPSIIAGLLYHSYGRTTDDASCIVIKCTGEQI